MAHPTGNITDYNLMKRPRIRKYERVDVEFKGRVEVSTSVFTPLSKEKLEQEKEDMRWNLDKKEDAWTEHARKDRTLHPYDNKFERFRNKVIYTPMK